MAAPKSKAPPWSDAFRNILKLEESRGFNNTAVAGGLDKFVQRWSSDMAGQATDSSDAGNSRLESCGQVISGAVVSSTVTVAGAARRDPLVSPSPKA